MEQLGQRQEIREVKGELRISFVFFVLEMGQIGNLFILYIHGTHLKATLKDENAQQFV
jgi:hypothetical protein